MDSVDIKDIDGVCSTLKVSVLVKSENGVLSGTIKDRKSRALVALAKQGREYANEIPDLWVITSGNAVSSLRGAIAEAGIEANITAFVNEAPYTHPLMLEHIRGQADKVVEMGFCFDDTPPMKIKGAEEAYRGIVWEIIRSGVVPDHLYLPVGSGEFAAQILLGSRWMAAYRFLSEINVDPIKAMEEIYKKRGKYGRLGFGSDDRLIDSADFVGLKKFCDVTGLQFDLEHVRSLFPNVVLSSEDGQFLSRFGYDDKRGSYFYRLTTYPGSDELTHVNSKPGVARKLALPCMSKVELESGDSLLKVLANHPHKSARISLCSAEEIVSGWRFLQDETDVQAEPSGAVPFAAFVKEMKAEKRRVSNGETVLVLNSGSGTYVAPDGELVIFNS